MDDRPSARYLLIALLGPAVFYILYSFRSLDDNSLTSWQWVFGQASALRIFMFVCLASVGACFLSGRRLPGHGLIAGFGFAAAALFWPEPEVIIDSSRYFTQAKHLSEYGIGYFLSEWGRGIEVWTDMPLVPMLFGLVFKFFGESRIAVQVFLAAMFSLSLWLTAKTGEELFQDSDPDSEAGRELGALGAMMLLAMPYLLSQTPLMLVDMPGMCLLMLSVFSYQRAVKRGGGWIVLAGGALVMLCLAKYSLWVMASVLCMVGLAHALKAPRGVLLRSAGVLLVWAAGFGAFLYAYQDVVAAQMRLLIEYQRPGLDRWGESHISTFFFQVHPFVTLAAIASVVIAWRRRDIRYIAIFWLPAVMLAMGVKRARYLIPVLPMLALMASYALVSLSDARTRRLVAYIAVTCSLAVSICAYLPYLRTNNLVNLMHAGRHLDTLEGDTVEVRTLPHGSLISPAVTVPMLDLYTKKRIQYTYTLKPVASAEEIAASPFRFTWEFRNPEYYNLSGEHRLQAIVHPDDKGGGCAEGYELIKKYDTSERIFVFRPFVSICRKLD